jgi:phosphopantetheinyl transferase
MEVQPSVKDKAEIDLWHYRFTRLGNVSPSLLSDKEHLQYASFTKKEFAERYLHAHIFLREVLAQYAGCGSSEIEFRYGAYGKPFLNNYDLHFSLSYRKGHVILAVCRTKEVGADIEFIRALQDVKTFCDFSFSTNEKQRIFTGDNIDYDTLFTLWACKEAYIKCTGTGLSVDLSRIDLHPFILSDSHYVLGKPLVIKKIEPAAGCKAAIAAFTSHITVTDFNFI